MKPKERLLSACRRERVDKTPVWFMRQAGRYLPEYREIRKERSIIEVCKTPSLCEQVTLLPVHRLGVDAAVLFADIMLPLEGIGISFRIEENLGPVISNPLRSYEEISKLRDFEANRDVPYVLEAINRVKTKLNGETALVGFSGAPFTIASYLIEGAPSRDYAQTKKMMFNDKDAWDLLLRKLSDTIFFYLSAQIRAGADCVQLFDSWVGQLSEYDYSKYVAPYVRSIFEQLKRDFPDTPTIHFGTGTYHLLDSMEKKAGGDVFSIDWRTPISKATRMLGQQKSIQGNLEPAVLLSSDTRFIAARIENVLEEAASAPGHVFNLGHGILKGTPVESAKFAVDYVHSHS